MYLCKYVLCLIVHFVCLCSVMLLNNFVFSRQKTGFEKFFGGKMFTAKRVVFSGKNFFLAPSLPENFHLRNEKF